MAPGVDEHTAALIDLERQTLSVAGKGNVYWRRDGDELTFATGTVVDLATIRSFEPSTAIEHTPTSHETSNIDDLIARAGEGGDDANRRSPRSLGWLRRRRGLHRPFVAREGSAGTSRCGAVQSRLSIE